MLFPFCCHGSTWLSVIDWYKAPSDFIRFAKFEQRLDVLNLSMQLFDAQRELVR
jgi:hypothetical protein